MKRQCWLGVVISALLMFPAAAAAAPIPGSGSVNRLSHVVVSTSTGGGGTTAYFNEMNTVTGTLSGVTASSGDCKTQSSGRISCRADGSFTGTVDGRAGGFFFSQATTVDGATGAYSGRISISGGSGELASLHGHGRVEGNGASGTYSVQLSL